MLKPAWHPNFQENQLCRRQWVSNNLERKKDHWGEKEREKCHQGWDGVSYRLRSGSRKAVKWDAGRMLSSYPYMT